MKAYRVKRFHTRPDTIEEAIQRAIAWYVNSMKQFPAGVLVNPTQLELASAAIPAIHDDLVKKFDGRVGDLPVDQVGGVLAWEIGLVIDD